VLDSAAGFLNDPFLAKKVVLQGRLDGRKCRHCNRPLMRVPLGAVVCSGTCDMPDNTDPEYTRRIASGQQ
jgi:hypothetical protein